MSSLDAALSFAPASPQSPPPAAQPPQILGPWVSFAWTAVASTAALLLVILAMVGAAVWNIAKPGLALTDAQIGDLAQATASVGFLMALGMIVLACRQAGWRATDYLALTRPRGPYLRLGAVALVVPLAVVLGLSFAGFNLAADSEMPKTIASLLITLISVSVVAPIWEELVFRGFLYRGLAASRLGVAGAIVVTSLLWAGLHFDRTWLGFGEIFFCGLVWGALRWRTGSTAATMAVHFLNNAIPGVAITGITLGWWS
jgi:CAAX protease family protein